VAAERTGRQAQIGRAVFVGVARNCADHLARVLPNLDRLAGTYEQASFLFAVSDSDDGTLSQLRDWLAEGRTGQAIDLGTLVDDMPLRTVRIAHARNVCLDVLHSSPYGPVDHVVVADMDDVLTEPVVVDAFQAAKAWLDGAPERAGLFANAAPRYYDIWALRHDSWCPADCWRPIWDSSSRRREEAAKFREVFQRQIHIPPTLPPIAVRSAFGGLALYKKRFLTDVRYRGTDERGREVCEHVAFNEAIGRAGGQLHILPRLVVSAPSQHLWHAANFSWPWRVVSAWQRVLERVRPPWRALTR
jgi:hypothetical protein